MSNPTTGIRVDYKPLDMRQLGESIEAQTGEALAAKGIIEGGSGTIIVDEIPITIRVSKEERGFNVDAYGDPGWRVLFNVVRDYSSRAAVKMVIFDQQYNYCVCVDRLSTREQVLKTIEEDPFEGERAMKEIGVM